MSPTNLHCAYCALPLPNEPMPNVGGVRFCSSEHIRDWFADGRHADRRRVARPVGHERRSA